MTKNTPENVAPNAFKDCPDDRRYLLHKPGPIFWPFLRRSARALTVKVVRATIENKAFLTIKRAVSSPYRALRSPFGAIRASDGAISSRCDLL